MKKAIFIFLIAVIINLDFLVFPRSVNFASAATIYYPYISLISPSSGKAGETVYISGYNFGTIPGEVTFGSFEGDIIKWGNSLIVVKVPSSHYGDALFVKVKESGDKLFYNYNIQDTFKILDVPSNDSYSHRQVYLTQTKVTDAWKEKSYGSTLITVAVIDSGVYMNHPDLINNMWRNNHEINGDNVDNDNNGYTDDYYGWNFLDNNADLTSKNDHGTMVAGIIGAEKNNGWGIAGIATGVKIMSLIVCNSSGCPREPVIKAIKYAADMGADIINLSLGGSGTLGFSADYNDAISYVFNKGVLIVAAAGNDDYEGQLGQNLDYIKASPVCNDGNSNMVLGVGAVDDDNKRPYWSSYSLNYVDIWAPGVDIYSTSVFSYSGYDFDYADGTSFSAPIVSGIAALIKSKYPTISSTALRDRIINTSNNGVADAYQAIKQPLSEEEEKSSVVTDPGSINNSGELVKIVGDGAVYFVKNNVKHVFPHAAIYFSWGFPADYSTVKTVPISTFYSYVDGNPVPFRSGYMFRGTTTSLHGKESSAVFIADGQKIRPINSGELYQELFNDPAWKLVIWIPDDLLSKFSYELGETLADSSVHPNGTLIRYNEDPDKIYLIENGKKRLITNAAFTSNGFDENQIIDVSSLKYNYSDANTVSGEEGALTEPF